MDKLNGKQRVLNTINRDLIDRFACGYYNLKLEVLKNFQDEMGFKDQEEILNFWNVDYRKFSFRFIKNPTEEMKSDFIKKRGIDWPSHDVDASTSIFSKCNAETYSDEVERPLSDCQSTKEIDKYPWPNLGWLDYDLILTKLTEHKDKAIIAPDWSPIFGTLCELFGMEGTLINLALNEDVMHAAIERITHFYYERNKLFFKKCRNELDIFFLGDDFASDKGLMISIDMWKKFFKKPIAKIVSLAKSYDLKVHYHCCAVMKDLLPELIEMGVNVIEPCQFHLPGMKAENLKREYGSDIVFYGGINTQYTLPFGTEEDVRNEVRHYKKVFRDEGGWIIAPDHTLMPGVPLNNILALYDEAKK